MNLNKDSKYMWNKEFNLEDHIGYYMHAKRELRMHPTPLYSRSDGHPPDECLHYCTPGPLNIIGRLLLHFLKVSAEYWMQSDTVAVLGLTSSEKGEKSHKHRPPSSGNQPTV